MMKAFRRVLPLLMILLAAACNLSQLTDGSGPDDVVSGEGIGSGWTGGNAGPGSGTGDEAPHPLVGQWVWNSQTCAVSPAIRLTLGANFEGRIEYSDCNQVCPLGQVAGFRWVASGLSSGNLQFNYTAFQVCGQQANTPDPDSRPYSFDGPNLVFAGVTWTKVG